MWTLFSTYFEYENCNTKAVVYEALYGYCRRVSWIIYSRDCVCDFCTDDKKTIAKASGIGPNTAARIILELKDKLMKEHAGEDFSAASAPATVAHGGAARGKLSEATDALVVLGYSRTEAMNVLKDIPTESMELEEIIRASLKKLMKY